MKDRTKIIICLSIGIIFLGISATLLWEGLNLLKSGDETPSARSKFTDRTTPTPSYCGLFVGSAFVAIIGCGALIYAGRVRWCSRNARLAMAIRRYRENEQRRRREGEAMSMLFQRRQAPVPPAEHESHI